MHTKLIAMLTKHAALAVQAAAGTLDDAGRADLAKYTAAAEALSGARALPAGLVVKVMDRAELQAWAEIELASGDADRLAVLKAALDLVAGAADDVEKFDVQVMPAAVAPMAPVAPVIDAAMLASMIEAAVAKALDARTISGVRVAEPVVEIAPVVDAVSVPEADSDSDPLEKGWHAGDWARLACGDETQDETP